jgi:hypothetical protein
VVRVTAGVVPDRCPDLLRHRLDVGEDGLDRVVRPRRAFERLVRIVDVGLVVLVVMEAHRLLVDVRLERRVVVGQRRDFERHLSLLSLAREDPIRLGRAS